MKGETEKMEKLPNSADELKALIVVSLVACFAALARVLYGKETLTWRYSLSSAAVAMVTGMLGYSVAVSFWGELSGYAGVAIGAACGTFTDDILKRAQREVKEWNIRKRNGE